MADATPERHPKHEEAIREAMTIGLYLSIVILAVLVGLSPDDTAAHHVGVIWGTSLGLGIAHLFAFRMTAVFAAGGKMTSEDAWSILGMVGATVVIAGVATLPYVFSDSVLTASTVSMFLLLALIALTSWVTARRAGLEVGRALLYTGVLQVLAILTVAVKYTLTH